MSHFLNENEIMIYERLFTEIREKLTKLQITYVPFSGLFSFILLPRNLSCSMASANIHNNKLSLNFYMKS